MLLRSTFRKRPLSKLLTENCIMEEVRSPNGRAYTWEEQHFNLQICNLLNLLFFLFFFQYKARISTFFTSCKMRNTFEVNNKDTRIRKVNYKVRNKDTVVVVVASLSLTLNTFHFLLVFLLLILISLLPAGVVVCCSYALCLLESI